VCSRWWSAQSERRCWGGRPLAHPFRVWLCGRVPVYAGALRGSRALPARRLLSRLPAVAVLRCGCVWGCNDACHAGANALDASAPFCLGCRAATQSHTDPLSPAPPSPLPHHHSGWLFNIQLCFSVEGLTPVDCPGTTSANCTGQLRLPFDGRVRRCPPLHGPHPALLPPLPPFPHRARRRQASPARGWPCMLGRADASGLKPLLKLPIKTRACLSRLLCRASPSVPSTTLPRQLPTTRGRRRCRPPANRR
jgi:hypothetical protein